MTRLGWALGYGILFCACSASPSLPADKQSEPIENPTVSNLPVAPGPTTSSVAGTNSRQKSPLPAPYLDGPARKAFLSGDFKAARRGFAELKLTSKKEKFQRALMLAASDFELARHVQAGKGFQLAAKRFPTLSNYLHLRSAQAFQAGGKLRAAEKQARKVKRRSTSGDEAAILLGKILAAQGQLVAARRIFSKYIDTSSLFLDEAYLGLGDVLSRKRQIPKAIRAYQQILIRFPVSESADVAGKKIVKLLLKKSKKQRAKLTRLSGRQYFTRGMALFYEHRNPQSASDLRNAIKSGELGKQEICTAAFHRAESWWKERNRTKSTPLFLEAISLCKKAKDPKLVARSTYQAGRSYMRLQKYEKAIAQFQALEKNHPKSNYADDARLRRAESLAEQGKLARADSLYATIPETYPNGDILDLGLWRVAFRAIREKRHQDAVRWLKKRKQLSPLDSHWKFEGQTDYWLGRSYAALGKKNLALAAYRETAEKYPVTYYALLALNRLRESSAKTFAEVKASIVETGSRPPPISIPEDLESNQSFQRALELARFGFGQQVELELKAAGLKSPPGKLAVLDPKEQNRLWVLASVYDLAGRYDKSHWVTRWHVVDYKRQWPSPENMHLWRLAFPKAYWKLLSYHADLHGHPKELQIAFVREESAFDPKLESWANAVGLTQMIFPTARDHARGIKVTRENLQDPAKNVTIGSRFLAGLLKKFDKQIGLAVPGYNAGAARIKRWRRSIGPVAQDEFAESIPGDQARGYAKRVIGSYFAYSWLERRHIPKVPLTLRD